MATVHFKLSQLSMTMIEGVVSKWYKQQGDVVLEGEVLLDVETDKMVKEMTAPAGGFLVKISAQEGEVVPIDGELCVISGDASWVGESGAKPEAPVAAAEKAAELPSGTTAESGKRISPLAKTMAKQKGISYETIVGTGPSGVIVKKDILQYLENQKTSPIKGAAATAFADKEDKVVAFAGIRKKTAENMMRSRQNTAMLTTCAEVNMSKIAECRKFMKVSYTTFVIKAVAKALEEEKFQMMRAQIVGEKIHIKQNIHINVSVATGHSLLTPVIHSADEKNILTIGEDLKAITEQAKNNNITAEDMENGCFTVTNSGVFGSLFYTPIINYPQSAIMGMGKLLKTPIVVENEIVIAPMMYLCLSYDHRLIDGEVGAPFLQKVKYYLEHPEEMIVS